MAKKEFSPNLKKDFFTANANSFSQRIEMIPLENVLPNDKNFYHIDDDEVNLLMEDIETQGLKHNLVVKANNDGNYTIISGHKRREAVRRLVEEKGFSPILPCYVESYSSEDDEMKSLIMLNMTQRKLSPSELMQSYEELKTIIERQKVDTKVKGRVRELVATGLGVSDSQVKKIENVRNNAIEEVKEAVMNDEISIAQADNIANFPEEKQKQIIEKENKSKAAKREKVREKEEKTDEFVSSDVTENTENSEITETIENAETTENTENFEIVDDIETTENSENNESIFGKRVDILLDQKGMSMQNLADILGVSRQNCYVVVKGNPNYKNLMRFSEALDVSIDFLVGKTDIQNNDNLFSSEEIKNSLDFLDLPKEKIQEILETLKTLKAENKQ